MQVLVAREVGRQVARHDQVRARHALLAVRNADGGSGLNLVVANDNRVGEDALQMAEHAAFGLETLVEEQGELVLSRTRNQGRLSVLQALGNDLDNLVAERMTICIVDVRKIVCMDPHHGPDRVAALGVGQVLLERDAVREVGQNVMVETVLQLVAGCDDRAVRPDRTAEADESETDDARHGAQ